MFEIGIGVPVPKLYNFRIYVRLSSCQNEGINECFYERRLILNNVTKELFFYFNYGLFLELYFVDY